MSSPGVRGWGRLEGARRDLVAANRVFAAASARWYTAVAEVSSAAKSDKHRHYEDLASEARCAAAVGDAKGLHRVIRLLSKAKPVHVLQIKDASGQVIKEPMAVRRRWHVHFAELLHAVVCGTGHLTDVASAASAEAGASISWRGSVL